MSCNCSNTQDGKAVIDLVRSKGKADMPLRTPYEINCSCGKTFTMKTLVDKCEHCGMTYGVTPCSQGDINNIKSSEIDY